MYFGLKGSHAGCGGRTPQTSGLLPPRPSLQGFDARRAATTRRFGALGRTRQSRKPSPHPSRCLLKCRKPGEGKLLASFPSPPEKARGIATEMRRTAKEVGGGGGTAASRQTSAFGMVSPSAKTAERILFSLCGKFRFVSFAVDMYF